MTYWTEPAAATLIASQVIVAALLAAFAAYSAAAVWAAVRWRASARPLDPEWTPAVTILKPVCGVDPDAYRNFVSFCLQDYPRDRIQLVFGAMDPGDPALELCEHLREEHPGIAIEIVPGAGRVLSGANRKVRTLSAMLALAKHEILVFSDSDMRVAPHYLRQIVDPFRPDATACAAETSACANGSGEVGLVTCPYRACNARGLAADLEGLAIGAEFIPGAMVNAMLEPAGFALGSSIAIPKPVLATVGGMESLADYLADDFQLGFRTRAAGYRVVLSTHVVEDVIGKESFRSTWSRRLRWARTIRCCRPAGYLGSVTTHGIALGLVFLCLTRFAPGGWYTLAAVTILRLCAAALLAGITGDRHVKRRILLLPLSDLLSAAIFVASYLGSAIVWRGAVYRLKPDGTLAPVPGRPQSPSA